ncbi:hypothetical protein EVAR_51140_1 [Eumeta japonica]|uniref:Uncharacterized protein n=1 Tax=Eumeta variegata TaxID=151549 RepID=A0A4C1YQM0_EUMVA|nr:hypothetical protein EVAR_51140_1 [Eumeta japonica]
MEWKRDHSFRALARTAQAERDNESCFFGTRANPVVLKPLSLCNEPLGGWTVLVLYSWEQHEERKKKLLHKENDV